MHLPMAAREEEEPGHSKKHWILTHFRLYFWILLHFPWCSALLTTLHFFKGRFCFFLKGHGCSLFCLLFFVERRFIPRGRWGSVAAVRTNIRFSDQTLTFFVFLTTFDRFTSQWKPNRSVWVCLCTVPRSVTKVATFTPLFIYITNFRAYQSRGVT